MGINYLEIIITISLKLFSSNYTTTLENNFPTLVPKAVPTQTSDASMNHLPNSACRKKREFSEELP